MLTSMLCWLVLWPMMLLRWGLPARSHARRPAGRPLAQRPEGDP